jgi:uncharacterized protein YjlB
MSQANSLIAPETFVFSDDGSIPNNPRLPFLVYRGAVDLKGSPDPEEVIEKTFLRNRWGEIWRNGVHPYVHYHSSIHEVMGLARGRAKVRFGGATGQDVEIAAGDVVVLPAGTGHQGLWASPDLLVIGAYPPNGRYDLCQGSRAEYAKAVLAIPQVPLPHADPVFGEHGALQQLWT